MMPMSLQTVLSTVHGTLVPELSEQSDFVDFEFHHIETDSRKPLENALFVALKGERFDGHDYVNKAFDSGAAAALVSTVQESEKPQIVVTDTLVALAELGRYQRQAHNIQTIGLTGSCGKTTTKEMMAAILATKGKVHATQGNYNNEFGVPFTLFELTQDDEYSVIEMGAGKVGDIDYLTKIALPNVALITCIAEAHLEGMGSLAGIAKTKAEIIHGLSENGTAVLPYDLRWLDSWKPKVSDSQNLTTFGLDADADFYATDITSSESGMQFIVHHKDESAAVQLPLPGEHNVLNGLAAIAATTALGLTLNEAAEGLARVGNTSGRLAPIAGINGSQILDDTYNANPKAMLAAGEVLSHYSQRKVFIAGDMAELGSDSAEIHRQVGIELKQLPIDQVLTVGEQSAYLSEGYGEGALHFISKESLIDYIKPELNEDTVLVVKGSRSSAMETVVTELMESNSSQTTTEESTAC